MRKATFGTGGPAAVVPVVGFVMHFPRSGFALQAAQASRSVTPFHFESAIDVKALPKQER